MKTWVKNNVSVYTGTGTSTLTVELPVNCVSVHVILTHGSGAWSVEKHLTPADYPGDDYTNTRFAIAFIAGWGFSYHWENSKTIRFRPYNTSGDVTNDGWTYRVKMVTGV